MTVANIVCIKWGDKYPPYFVDRLYYGVRRFMTRKFRFICFTENPAGIDPAIEVRPLPVVPFEHEIVEMMDPPRASALGLRMGAWRKVSLYQPGLFEFDGPVLGLDLDIVITGPLEDFLDYAPGKLCMRLDWGGEKLGQRHGNSSVFRFEPGRHSYIYDAFAADPWECARKARGREQEHTSYTAIAHGDFEFYPSQWVASFKEQSIPPRPYNWFRRPQIPAGARVVTFYGHIKMEYAMRGRFFRWRYANLPVPWLKDYWLQQKG